MAYLHRYPDRQAIAVETDSGQAPGDAEWPADPEPNAESSGKASHDLMGG